MQNQYSTGLGKQSALIGIPVIMLIAGLYDHTDLLNTASQKTTAGNLANIVSNISVCILTFLWYRQDAAEQGFARTRAWDIGIIFITVAVVLPWYLFKTRGFKRGMASFARLLAFVVVGLVVPYLVGLSFPYAFAAS